MKPVTDPALLDLLNAGQPPAPPSRLKPVTDPTLLNELEGKPARARGGPKMISADTPPAEIHADQLSKQVRIIDGKTYRQDKDTKEILDPDMQIVTDPKIVEAFGPAAPNAKGRKALDLRNGNATEVARGRGVDEPAPTVDMSTWTGDLAAGWHSLKQAYAGSQIDAGQRRLDAIDQLNQISPPETVAPPSFMEALVPGLTAATPGNIAAARQRQVDQAKELQTLGAVNVGKEAAAAQQYPESPAAQAFNNSKTFGEAWSAFVSDPASVARSTILRSAAPSVPSVVGGIIGSVAGPIGSAAGAGYGSLYTELGSSIADGLQANGADLHNPQSIMEVWQKHGREITQEAYTRAGIIGAFDAATAGIGSKIAAGPGSAIKKELLGIGVQASGGAGGEATAQLATEGQITSPGAVAGEALGEVASGGVEQAGQIAVEGYKKARRQAAAQSPQDAPSPPPGRQEPQFEDIPGQAPQQPASGNLPVVQGRAPAAPPESPARQLLIGSGYTPEQVDDMSPEEAAAAVAEAKDQGIEPAALPAPQPAPEAAGEAPQAPAAGTAPMAPRRPVSDPNLIKRLEAPAGSRKDRVTVTTEQDLEAVRPVVNAEPTEAQAKAGNYQKGHIRLHGFDVSIENAKGSVRRGRDEDGTEWQTPNMPVDYGYIKGTVGRDKDHLDVYIGPNTSSDMVYVVDQNDLKTGRFDEHKTVFGASSFDEAKNLYAGTFSDGRGEDRIGHITEMTVDQFKDWVKNGNKRKPFSPDWQRTQAQEAPAAVQPPQAPTRSKDQLMDFGTEPINGYGDAEGNSNPVKANFLNDAAHYLRRVAKELQAKHGFTPYLDKKGKPERPVRINEGGPAVPGDVYLTLQHPNAAPIEVIISHGVIKPGTNVMARTGRGGKSGPNQWWVNDLTVDDMVKHLYELSGAWRNEQQQPEPTAAPAPEPEQQQQTEDMSSPIPEGAAPEPDRPPEQLAEPETPAEPAQNQQDEAAAGPDDRTEIVQEFRKFLANPDNSFRTIVEARRFAAERGFKASAGTLDAKALDEMIEQAVVLAARDLVAQSSSPSVAYNFLVDLYARQPILGVRTSTSMMDQAYSTPMPLAYLASRLAGVSLANRVYEPTAGNGALLLEADPAKTWANELNADRAKALFDQGFRVSQQDAAKWGPAGAFDVIIGNPPFGTVPEEDGSPRRFDVRGWKTTQIDHVIALGALERMKPNGRAVLLVGSVKEAGDSYRSDAYNSKQKREFYFRLYRDYNVVDHFTISGTMYKKQGAAWPVDVIVIDGKGKSQRGLPAVALPPIFTSWDSLEGKLNDAPSGTRNEAAPAERDVPAQPDRPDGEEVRPELEAGSSADQRVSDGERPAEVTAKPDKPAAVPVGSDTQQRPDLGEQLPAGVGEAPVQASDGDERVRDSVPASPTRERLKDRSTSDAAQKVYQPLSSLPSLGTNIPTNMADSVEASLANIAERHGDVDSWIERELGYEKGELRNFLAAEQVDAVALAIDNVKKNAAFIIGDQTGIGKGRVVASALRYAMRKGLTPIFITEKPNLYGDMIRDLNDIGIEKMLGRPLNAFLTNAGESIPLDDEAVSWFDEAQTARAEGGIVPPKRGRFLRAAAHAAHKTQLQTVAREGAGPTKSFDIIFTTYDQMNTVKGQTTDRRRLVETLAPFSFMVLDESHNAGGTEASGWEKKDAAENRSDFLKRVTKEAKAVMFSSATYAKRPGTMALYAKTDMGKAVEKPEMLGPLIERGDVPMQQIVASMLAKAGQYIRRERSFEGVEYKVEPVPVSVDSYEAFSTALRKTAEFDIKLHESDVWEKWLDDLKANAEAAAHDSAVGEAAVTSTNFTALIHNLVSQMLLSIKADAVADRAIEAFKAGEKPVITVANTMGSFLKAYGEEHSISKGDTVDLSFKEMVRRYLDRSRRITVKKPDDDAKKEHRELPLSDLTPDLLRVYEEALMAIEAIDTNALPVSPIDWIRYKLAGAGLRVGEITGRKEILNYKGSGRGTYDVRKDSDISVAGRRVAVDKFNRGDLDAMILNRAGSTGLSLHASSKFKDKRRRRMIIAQAELNIDVHMQMLGRIHRTGQVVTPVFTQAYADVPAEARPAAVLAKKMASLNANTTAARKSAFSADDSIDFLNKYGDQVAAELLNEEFQVAIDLDLEVGDGPEATKDLARKLSGRLVMLPINDQRRILDELSRRYVAMITNLDALGENMLEAKTMDLGAKTIERTILKEGEGDSPFTQPAYIEQVEVKSQGLGMPVAEIVETAAQSLTGQPLQGVEGAAALRRIEQMAQEKRSNLTEPWRQQTLEYRKTMIGSIKDEQKRNEKSAEVTAQYQRWFSIMEMVTPGQRVSIKAGENEPVTGIALKVSRRDMTAGSNPMALGAWTAKIALPDNRREISVPLSSVALENDKVPEGAKKVFLSPPDRSESYDATFKAFEAATKEGKATRFIITGNILSGFDQTGGAGQIVNYTDDKGDVQPGILMSNKFDKQSFMDQRAVRFKTAKQVIEFMRKLPNAEVISHDNLVEVKLDSRGGYEFEIPAGRGTGGKYFLNPKVMTATNSGFVKVGSKMRFSTDVYGSAVNALQAMMDVGAVFQTRENQDEAQAIINADKEGGFSEDEPIPLRTDTPAFKRWFGNSKVVDANGKPLVVYHGTRHDITAFDPEKQSKKAFYGKGFYFTVEPEVAGGLGRWKEMQDVENAASFNMAGFAWQGAQFKLSRELTKADVNKALRRLDSNKAINDAYSDIGIAEHRANLYKAAQRSPEDFAVELAKEPGWGLLELLKVERVRTTAANVIPAYLSIQNPAYSKHEIGPENDGLYIKEKGYWIAFKPTQIKSIFNRGTWDGEDPSILAEDDESQFSPPKHYTPLNSFIVGDMPDLGERAREYVLRQGKRLNAEVLLAFDDAGNVAADGYGIANHVSMPVFAMKMAMDPDAELTIHHNHPSGSSFSGGDLRMLAKPGIRIVYAHGANNHVYRASIPAAVRKAIPPSRLMDIMDGALADVDSGLISWGGRLQIEHGYTDDDLRLISNHVRALALQKAGLIEYTSTKVLSPVQQKLTAEAIDRAAARIRKGISAYVKLESSVLDDTTGRPLSVRAVADLGEVFTGRTSAAGRGLRESVSREEGSPPDRGPPRAQGEDGFSEETDQPLSTFFYAHDERVFTALADHTDTLLNRIRRAGKAFAKSSRRNLQDRDVDLKLIQGAIRREGRNIPESQDAYLAASLFPGRVAQADKNLIDEVVQPLIDDITKRGLTLEEVDQFNKARHAFERNLEIGKLYEPGTQFHEAMTDPHVVGGSGMSDFAASTILDNFETAGKLDDLTAIGDKIVALNRRTLQMLANEGLITEETYDALAKQYDFYVPLRGFEDPADDFTDPERIRSGKRFDVRGKEFKEAFGRLSRADSTTAFSILQARQALVRIEKNRVGKRFLRLAQSHPNPDIWEVNKVEYVKIKDKATGLVRRVRSMVAQHRDNDFAVKVGGKAYHVTIHHEGLLRGMKGLGGEAMGEMVQVFHRIMRVLAATRTSYDPEFIFRNMIRDAQEAAINLQEENIKGLASKVLRSAPKALQGMNRMLNGDRTSTWAKHAKEFADAGGKVGYLNRGDIEAEKRSLEKMMKEASPSMSRASWLLLRKQLFDRIERWNDSVENAIRLSTFVQLRSRGYSRDRAAFVARELTVNFNRKGEWGPSINAFYMFFNARVQGTANLAMRIGRSKRLRQIALGIMGFAFMQGILNHLIAGDDDDEKNRYDKIPDEVKARNFIIMMPKGSSVPYIKWPLPPGYGLFHVLGTQMAEFVNGARTPTEVSANILGSLMNAFNPIDSGSTAISIFLPTLLQPVGQISTNQDYFGKPVVPDSYDKTKPMSQRFDYTDSPPAIGIVQGLNSLTGGNEVRSGAIDLAPGWLQLTWDFALGGLGQLVSRVNAVRGQWGRDEEINAQQVPFARVFVGQSFRYADRETYREIVDKVEVVKNELDMYREKRDSEGMANLRRSRAAELAMIPLLDGTKARPGVLTLYERLSKEQRKVDREPGLPDATRRARIKQLQEEKDQLMLVVRKRWNELQPTR